MTMLAKRKYYLYLFLEHSQMSVVMILLLATGCCWRNVRLLSVYKCTVCYWHAPCRIACRVMQDCIVMGGVSIQ